MKFFLAQINPIIGDLEGNSKKIIAVAAKAYSNSADFVLTPELSLWGMNVQRGRGYPPKRLDCSYACQKSDN